jgi:L-asparaginase
MPSAVRDAGGPRAAAKTGAARAKSGGQAPRLPRAPSAALQASVVVVIGTGGTIAGQATTPQAHLGYKAGQLAAEVLVAAVPPLAGQAIEAHTLAQLDSCDMDHATWHALHSALRTHLARPEVQGVVVTHGTDTLEETAYFLHRTLKANKPVVLTAAMRPATALSADGPQNLLDAVTLARYSGACGVLVVFAGKVFAAPDLRKVHGYRVEAFEPGDAGLLGHLVDGQVRLHRPWPQPALHLAASRLPPADTWPAVDVLMSHAGARGAALDALVAAGARGIIVAGTGNGSVHHSLLQAARRAQTAGVPVWRASRCLLGGVVEALVLHNAQGLTPLPSAGELTPAQARVELMLSLMV